MERVRRPIKPKFVVLLLLVILALVAALIFISTTKQLNLTPTKSQNTEALYSPSQYGIPETLAGYKVLAVLSSQDVACMNAEVRRVVLQATQNDVQEFTESSSRTDLILNTLEQIGSQEIRWQVEYVGPHITVEEIASTVESWNSIFRGKQCISFGGPQLIN